MRLGTPFVQKEVPIAGSDCRQSTSGSHQTPAHDAVESVRIIPWNSQEEALARHGKPEIFNTDQGSQFTGCTLPGFLDTGSHYAARLTHVSSQTARASSGLR